MNFFTLQKRVVALILAHPTFSTANPTSVLADLGSSRMKLEESLDKNGYSIGVWPPIKGVATEMLATDRAQIEATLLVRLEINPKKIAQYEESFAADNSTTSPDAFVTGLIAGIVEAVLGDDPEPNGSRFQLGQEAFDMINLDEGLLAFHIRFTRLSVI